jgi:TM2 domain-containing membrane protein YozV
MTDAHPGPADQSYPQGPPAYTTPPQAPPGYGQAQQPPGAFPQPGYGVANTGGYPSQNANYPMPGPGMVVAPKSPGVALLASFFVPGLGSMINGEVGKGVGILIGYFFAVILSFLLIGIPFAIGLWIWGMVDAYTGAQSWNARHGIYS